MSSSYESYTNLVQLLEDRANAVVNAFRDGDLENVRNEATIAEITDLDEGLADFCSRDEIADRYVEGLQKQDIQDRELQSMYHQHELLAAYEKASRLRYGNRKTMLEMAASRSLGQVNPNGYVTLSLRAAPKFGF